MTGLMTEGVVYDPPEPPHTRRTPEEHHAVVAEWNATMAAWHATDPCYAGLTGQPVRASWEPRPVPDVPSPAEQRSLTGLGPHCPEHQQERETGVAIPDYDHTCFREQHDFMKQFAPKIIVKQMPDRSGRMTTTWLKPGIP